MDELSYLYQIYPALPLMSNLLNNNMQLTKLDNTSRNNLIGFPGMSLIVIKAFLRIYTIQTYLYYHDKDKSRVVQNQIFSIEMMQEIIRSDKFYRIKFQAPLFISGLITARIGFIKLLKIFNYFLLCNFGLDIKRANMICLYDDLIFGVFSLKLTCQSYTVRLIHQSVFAANPITSWYFKKYPKLFNLSINIQ